MICNDCGRDIDQAQHRADCKPRVSAISDIHDGEPTDEGSIRVGTSFDEIKRLRATVDRKDEQMAELQEHAQKMERERDDAQAHEQQMSVNHAAMHDAWMKEVEARKRAERAMAQMAAHDSDGNEYAHVVTLKGRIAELEAALRRVRRNVNRDHEASCAKTKLGIGCLWCETNVIIDAALSPAPAQPETAAKEWNPSYAVPTADCAGCAKVARHPGEGYVCMVHYQPPAALPSPTAMTHRLEDCGCIEKCPEHSVAADPLGIEHGTSPAARDDEAENYAAEARILAATKSAKRAPLQRRDDSSSNRDDTERSRILELEKALRQVRRYCRKVIDERYIHIIDAVLSPALEPPNRVDEVCNFRWDTTDGHHYCGEDPATKHRHVCACCNEFAT